MTTPAGWYDDGSGRQRWWNGQSWTDIFRPVVAPRPAPSAHLWWALSPLYSCFLISFIPAVHAAIKLKRRGLWYVAVGLIVGNFISWALVLSGPSDPKAASTPLETTGAFLALVLAIVGTIHALRLRSEVFPPAETIVMPVGPAAGPAIDPAIATSLAARTRRAQSVELSRQDPGLARDLRIGRPDLARQYDDGGLVDVNHVPEAVLVSHLGFTPEQARAVVSAREQVGGFTSVDDLSVLADLPPQMLDAVRDHVVTL